jgi:hypothetical protein
MNIELLKYAPTSVKYRFLDIIKYLLENIPDSKIMVDSIDYTCLQERRMKPMQQL